MSDDKRCRTCRFWKEEPANYACGDHVCICAHISPVLILPQGFGNGSKYINIRTDKPPEQSDAEIFTPSGARSEFRPGPGYWCIHHQEYGE